MRVARALVGIAVIPTLLMGVGAGDAFADAGLVTWTNVATNRCLRHNVYTSLGEVTTGDCTNPYNQWVDSQNPDGSWDETAWAMLGSTNPYNCLTSYTDNSVYIEGCNQASGTNSYERWWENATQTGWMLQNVATSRILDSNAAGNVYTLDSNGGNYQRWT
ncbi:RICIN domain-containing protein [Kitasatospora griseola]|uniref:RICIN domain-containing protein n=1 Tax=Kitasatospora griseola TaxID=2064 RepID=UPI00381BDC0B